MNKYVLNTKTGTLHILDKCCHAYYINDGIKKIYCTEEQAIKENQFYIKRCKICFRGI